jgi:hypothetical protein
MVVSDGAAGMLLLSLVGRQEQGGWSATIVVGSSTEAPAGRLAPVPHDDSQIIAERPDSAMKKICSNCI